MVFMAKNTEGNCSVVNISSSLGISKIYLEQIFSLLKKAELVKSIKGSKGGYVLVLPPETITVYQILFATETSLFERTEDTVKEKFEEIEQAMRSEIFDDLDIIIKQKLENITLLNLLKKAEINNKNAANMFYI
jgi:Rrf2 family protein